LITARKISQEKRDFQSSRKNKRMALLSTKPVDGSFLKTAGISLSPMGFKQEPLNSGELVTCISTTGNSLKGCGLCVVQMAIIASFALTMNELKDENQRVKLLVLMLD
jgi:hypothetical protein